MIDIIVILVIAVFVLLGVKSTIKHFKGEGACCGGGGGSLPPEKRKTREFARSSERRPLRFPACTANTASTQSPKPSTRLTVHPQKSACTAKKPWSLA